MIRLTIILLLILSSDLYCQTIKKTSLPDCFPLDSTELNDLSKGKKSILLIYSGLNNYLKAFNETKLCAIDLEPNIFRMTYVRSFHIPIIIEISPRQIILKKWDSDKIETLKSLRLPSDLYKSNYDNNTKNYSVKTTKISDKDFINIKNRILSSPLQINDSVSGYIVEDGSEILFESKINRDYNFAVVFNPIESDFKDIINFILLNYTDLKLLEIY